MEPLKSRFILQETVSFLWKLAVVWVSYKFQVGKEETLFDIIGNIHIIRFRADSWMRTLINVTCKAITRRWDIYLFILEWRLKTVNLPLYRVLPSTSKVYWHAMLWLFSLYKNFTWITMPGGNNNTDKMTVLSTVENGNLHFYDYKY